MNLLNNMYGLAEIPPPLHLLERLEHNTTTVLLEETKNASELLAKENPKRALVVARDRVTDELCMELVQRFAGPAGVEIHFITPTTGDPADEVRRMALALEMDCICIVTRGGPGIMSLFLSGDDEKILRSAPCPVVSIADSVIARWESSPLPQRLAEGSRILLPILGTQACVGAIYHCAALAKHLDTVVDLLEIDEQPCGSAESARSGIVATGGMRGAAFRDDLMSLAGRAIPKHLRGSAESSLRLPAFYAIIRATKDANRDLIVLGVPTRRWRVDGRIDVGTERVIRGARCPVICVPETANRGGYLPAGGQRERRCSAPPENSLESDYLNTMPRTLMSENLVT